MSYPNLWTRRRSPAGLCVAVLFWPFGLGLLVSACSSPGGEATADRAGDALDLVIVSMDTVRPDHTGAYGYHRTTTPHLDRLAENAVVFERALAPVPLTGPSHASVLTGRQPWSRSGHGLRKNGIRLRESVPFLAEVLQDAGWQTSGFVSGFPLTDQLSGFGRGFDVYDDAVEDLRRPGEDTVDAALEWWTRAAPNEPDQGSQRFLFLHLYDAHGPYRAPPATAARFRSGEKGPWARNIPQYQRRLDPKTGGIITDLRHYIDRYDAAIFTTDHQMGRLLAEVDPTRTVVLVMSDHGETLDERRLPLDHGSRLYEEQMRAVAVLAAPGLEPARIDAMVSLADFGPTLLDLAGLGPHALGRPVGEAPGRSLRSLLEGRRKQWRSRIRLATNANRQIPKQRQLGLGGDDFLAGVVDDEGWKLIVYSGDDTSHELYRLESDAGEVQNLAELSPEHARRLEAILLARGGAILRPPAQTLEIDPEAAAALRALGYVSDGPDKIPP